MTDSVARPHITVILAMSADGKIADRRRSPARFGSNTDKLHLEQQIAQADGVLFGSGTLHAYGTTLRVTNPDLLQQRHQQGKPHQPAQIVCSRRAQLDRQYPFFRQDVPRWLLTTPTGARHWQDEPEFERILIAIYDDNLDWNVALQQLADAGISRLAVLGGGQLVGSLADAGLIDELWLTVCPLLLGGANSPTPVEGKGFLANAALRLTLLTAKTVEQEVFLHYRLQREKD